MTSPVASFRQQPKTHRQILIPGYESRIKGLFGNSLVAYWRLNEATGSVAKDVSPQINNGSYVGATLANISGPPKTKTLAPFFDGANDKVGIYSAGLIADLDFDEASFILWCKAANAGVWTDGLQRRILNCWAAPADNEWLIRKTAANNTLQIGYWPLGGTKTVSISPVSPANWFHLAMTVSISADQFKAYLNGAQTGATQTGLLAWTAAVSRGDLAESAWGGQNWHGWLAHAAWINRPTTPAEIAKVYAWGM